jgi:integrase
VLDTVQKISTRTIDEFKAKRSRETKGEDENAVTISGNTVNKNIRHLRAMMRVAHRWGYMPILPEFKLLKIAESEPQAIDPATFDKIIEEAGKMDERLESSQTRKRMLTGKSLPLRGPAHNPPGSDWWTAFLSVAYLAGLRWNEILSLRWADLSFTNRSQIRIWNQKAGRFDHVPLLNSLCERLKTWMNKATNVSDNAIVFPHSCHDRTLHTTWDRIQKWAKVGTPFRFHDLRVSFCTNLVAAGVEAPTLMKLARHRSIATTMKYYHGRTDEADRRAIERMEAAFSTVVNGNGNNPIGAV